MKIQIEHARLSLTGGLTAVGVVGPPSPLPGVLPEMSDDFSEQRREPDCEHRRGLGLGLPRPRSQTTRILKRRDPGLLTRVAPGAA